MIWLFDLATIYTADLEFPIPQIFNLIKKIFKKKKKKLLNTWVLGLVSKITGAIYHHEILKMHCPPLVHLETLVRCESSMRPFIKYSMWLGKKTLKATLKPIAQVGLKLQSQVVATSRGGNIRSSKNSKCWKMSWEDVASKGISDASGDQSTQYHNI